MNPSKHTDVDKGHGRIEERTCPAINVPKYLENYTKEWAELKSLTCVNSKREINGQVENEKRFFISSLNADAAKLNNTIRLHWAIENSLHWVLDVTFKDDDSRIRRGMASENMIVMKHLAINLFKNDKKNKLYIPRKQPKALFYDYYREMLLKNSGF